MKRSQGLKSRTRRRLRINPRERGQKPLSYLLIDYNVGDKVLLSIDPSTNKGQPHRRYHGKEGVILEKRGMAYVIGVRDGGKTRHIIALPNHLRTI